MNTREFTGDPEVIATLVERLRQDRIADPPKLNWRMVEPGHYAAVGRDGREYMILRWTEDNGSPTSVQGRRAWGCIEGRDESGDPSPTLRHAKRRIEEADAAGVKIRKKCD